MSAPTVDVREEKLFVFSAVACKDDTQNRCGAFLLSSAYRFPLWTVLVIEAKVKVRENCARRGRYDLEWIFFLDQLHCPFAIGFSSEVPLLSIRSAGTKVKDPKAHHIHVALSERGLAQVPFSVQLPKSASLRLLGDRGDVSFCIDGLDATIHEHSNDMLKVSVSASIQFRIRFSPERESNESTLFMSTVLG